MKPFRSGNTPAEPGVVDHRRNHATDPEQESSQKPPRFPNSVSPESTSGRLLVTNGRYSGSEGAERYYELAPDTSRGQGAQQRRQRRCPQARESSFLRFPQYPQIEPGFSARCRRAFYLRFLWMRTHVRTMGLWDWYSKGRWTNTTHACFQWFDTARRPPL